MGDETQGQPNSDAAGGRVNPPTNEREVSADWVALGVASASARANHSRHVDTLLED